MKVTVSSYHVKHLLFEIGMGKMCVKLKCSRTVTSQSMVKPVSDNLSRILVVIFVMSEVPGAG
jgi:hypothetical protein